MWKNGCIPQHNFYKPQHIPGSGHFDVVNILPHNHYIIWRKFYKFPAPCYYRHSSIELLNSIILITPYSVEYILPSFLHPAPVGTMKHNENKWQRNVNMHRHRFCKCGNRSWSSIFSYPYKKCSCSGYLILYLNPPYKSRPLTGPQTIEASKYFPKGWSAEIITFF